MQNIKVVLMGDVGSGKTTISDIYVKNAFDIYTPSTIGSAYQTKKIKVDIGNETKIITCEIWDTAGSERFRSLVPMYCRNAHLTLLVFDLNNRESFENIPQWYDIVMSKQNGNNPKFLLIGNKEDLAPKVSKTEIDKMCKKYGFQYHQISCLSMDVAKKLHYMFTKNVTNIHKMLENTTTHLIDFMDEEPSKGCCFN